jgi:hypothetical protein
MDIIGVEQRLKEKAERNLHDEIRNKSDLLRNLIKNDPGCNPEVEKILLNKLDDIENRLFSQMKESRVQEAIDKFVGFANNDSDEDDDDDDDDDDEEEMYKKNDRRRPPPPPKRSKKKKGCRRA